MTVTPSTSAKVAPFASTLSTPTGAPVPGEVATGFLSLLLAALPGSPAALAEAVPSKESALAPALPGLDAAEVEGEVEGEGEGEQAPVDPSLVVAGLGMASGRPPAAVPASAAVVPAAVEPTPASEPLVAADQAAPLTGSAAPGGTVADPEAPVQAGGSTASTGAGAQDGSGARSPVTEAGAPGPVLPGTTDAHAGATGTGEPAAASASTPTVATSPPVGAPGPDPVDSVQGLAGLTAPAPAAGSDARSGAAAAPQPVAAQVFPEVTRMVSRGDGTHRLTLTLSPEALGDVRVTLVVRNGEVTVTFAANDQAQQALVESAPELRRLLELSGMTESRVLVRDAAAPAGASASSLSQDQPGQQGGDSRSGAGTQTPEEQRERADHHAGTRGGQNAMDGTTTRGRDVSSPPHEPALDTRTRGVDVTV